MNLKTIQTNCSWKITARLAILALLVFVSSASAQLTVTPSSQLGTAPFTPAWSPNTTGLLTNLAPTTATGNFAEFGTGGAAANLTTVGESIQVRPYSGAGNLEMCGSDGTAGSVLVYTVSNSASAYGYNITNITVYGAWQDSGRDRQDYIVYYSTVSAPTTFIPLTGVDYDPSDPGNIGSATRVVIHDLSGGPIAANVYQLKFVFNILPAEAGAAGYVAITAQGTAATGTTNVLFPTTYTDQQLAGTAAPSWVIEANSLINGKSPNSSAGNFANYGSGGVSMLTDGSYGVVGNLPTLAAAGSSAGTTLVYTLTNSANGSDLTNIVVYDGWSGSRYGQYYNISYSTVSAPSTFIPLTSVCYKAPAPPAYDSTRVAIGSSGIPLAKNVYSLKFDFTPEASYLDNGASIYGEIIVQGTNSAPPPLPPSPILVQDTLPSYAETVAGDQVVFTATYSNAPVASLQWLFISSGVTNVLANQTNSTLTLSSLQTTNSGSYTLEAVNATNGTALPAYTTAASLVVNSVPAPVNNISKYYAGQVGLGAVSLVNPSATFVPTWSVNTNNDLVLGSTHAISGPGTFTNGTGSFGLSGCNTNAAILTDGSGGAYIYGVVTNALTSCGTAASGAATAITYTLNTSVAANGFDLTNLTVYGGWGDAGRNEQKYQVLYSTVANPTTFISLGTYDYIPTDTSTFNSATRMMLIPASGILARNVAAVTINWDVAPSKISWNGYSEIVVQGTPSPAVPLLTQDTLPGYIETTVGNQVTFTAAFSNAPAANVQWQFLSGGTTNDLAGATSSTLTLNNVQLTNSGTYRLKAANATNSAVTTFSTAAPLVVLASPAPINNVNLSYSGQVGTLPFTPTWTPIAGSLIAGLAPTTATGNFGEYTGATVDKLTKVGNPLTISSYTTPPATNLCMAGTDGTAGSLLVYTLPASTYGYNLTNITVYGGWENNGRDAQNYAVLYATAANPTNFQYLTSVNYNPLNPGGAPSATVVAINGTGGSVIASNVEALEFVFSPAENGAAGYTAVTVQGTAATTNVIATLPPLVRILPVGDSITWGDSTVISSVSGPVLGGYRLPVASMLNKAGYNVAFSGLINENNPPGINALHEGHRGAVIAQVDNIMPGVLANTDDPDIILLLIGTNDYGSGNGTGATNRLDAMITHMATNRPNAKIIVANVLLRTDNPTIDAQITNTFNPFIPGIVAAHAALGQQVYFTDLRSVVTTNGLSPDGLHPNASGYASMAAQWMSAITNVIGTYGSTNAPVISHVVGQGSLTNVVVTFSKPVADSATNLANFTLSGGVTISAATLDAATKRVVTLTTSPLTPNASYTLTVSGVVDVTAAQTPIAGSAAATFNASGPRGATNNVAEASHFQLAYSLEIQNATNFSSGLTYTVDNHAGLGAFGRVAYYLELQSTNGGPVQYMWVSMNPFTTNLAQIGVPTLASGAVFQQYVTNMNVASSVAGIVTGTNLAGGNIEFWPYGYSAANALSVTNASASVFDWGDQNAGTANFGSMQIANPNASQMLLSFNDWGNTVGAAPDLGIGNNTVYVDSTLLIPLDWTFRANAPSYAVKTLQVFIQPVPVPGTTNVVVLLARGTTLATSNLVALAGNPANYSLSVTSVSATSTNGSAVSLSGGNITYTPSLVGSDLFTYILSDGNGGTATGTVTLTINTNHPPTAQALTLGALSGTPVTLPIIGGKYAPTDADGDPLTISAVQTPSSQGGAVSTDGTNVTYTALGSFAGTDTFTYTVSDGYGGFATATITANVVASGGGYNNLSGPVSIGGGQSTITYAGIPNYKYALETTASLALPVTWTPVITNTANSTNGVLKFTFSTGSGSGYFRTRYVP